MFFKKSHGAKAGYQVTKASKAQVDEVFDRFYKREEVRKNAIVFVATDNKDNIIGYLVAEAGESLAERLGRTIPFASTDWFIGTIFVAPKRRRQGVGTALLQEAIKHAQQAGVRHLLGSCLKTPAHLFWYKHHFCFILYGQKLNDANIPDEYGNYPHMIVRRLDKKQACPHKQDGYQIVKATQAQLDLLFGDHILQDGLKFFHDKKGAISGLSAVDEEDTLLGMIGSYPYELGTPLNGTQWMIPYIYVRPASRGQGIGSALVGEMIKAAREANVKQLTCLYVTEEASKFLYQNNFGVCNYYIMDDIDGRRAVSAALRLDD